MKQVIMKLHPYWQRHAGHCQITYVTRNDTGQRLVYCLQDNGQLFGGVRLMRCSQEGEPCHQVSFNDRRAVFEKPKGDSKLEADVRIWIENYDKGGHL